MNLAEMQPEDLIVSSWHESYEDQIEAIREELVRLNASLFILEELLTSQLVLPESIYFWGLIEYSLFEACTMIAWRVSVDSSSENGLTLRQIKNGVFQHLKADEYRNEFRKILREKNFEAVVEKIEPTIGEIRHNYIAHFNLEKHIYLTPEQKTLRVSDLRKITDELNAFFKVLCFGHTRMIMPLEYQPDFRRPKLNRLADVQKVLATLAKDNHLLNMPEQSPDQWAVTRQKMKPDDLDLIHEYRIRLGLSSA